MATMKTFEVYTFEIDKSPISLKSNFDLLVKQLFSILLTVI